MGAYWGSRWLAVVGDPKTARVEQVDMVPFGVVETSDRLICPTPPELEGCPSFESESDAVRAVKAHILKSTETPILELVVAIEGAKLAIEEAKLLDARTESYQRALADRLLTIKELTEELKLLRAVRRAKVVVR